MDIEDAAEVAPTQEAFDRALELHDARPDEAVTIYLGVLEAPVRAEGVSQF